MRLTFLGTGSAMPSGERAQSGLLLEDEHRALLVDCGSGVLDSLARTGLGYEGVSTVLLTHHHLDHVSDLLPLLKARWLAGEEHLTVVGPEGTTDLVEGLLSVHDYLRNRVDLTLREIGPDEPFEVAGFDVAAMETRHSVYCLAYRFDSMLAFSADSEAFTGLVEFADGCALLVHDCSFPDEVDVSNHPTPSQLGKALAAADADVGRVYLTHIYPHAQGREERLLESIGEHYDGDVRVAHDGLGVDVTPTD